MGLVGAGLVVDEGASGRLDFDLQRLGTAVQHIAVLIEDGVVAAQIAHRVGPVERCLRDDVRRRAAKGRVVGVVQADDRHPRLVDLGDHQGRGRRAEAGEAHGAAAVDVGDDQLVGDQEGVARVLDADQRAAARRQAASPGDRAGIHLDAAASGHQVGQHIGVEGLGGQLAKLLLGRVGVVELGLKPVILAMKPSGRSTSLAETCWPWALK